MRLFLAIDPPLEIKKALFQQLLAFRQEYPHFKWSSAEDYHITIHHFGEKAESEAIEKTIDELVFDMEPFYMYSAEAEVFIKENLTFYLDFLRTKKLEELAEELANRYHAPARKFSSHITFARARTPSKQQYFLLKKKLKKLELDIEFKVENLILFQSITSAEKTIYKTIHEFSLTK